MRLIHVDTQAAATVALTPKTNIRQVQGEQELLIVDFLWFASLFGWSLVRRYIGMLPRHMLSLV